MNKVLTAALMGLSAMALVGCSQDEMSSLKGGKYKGVMESAVDSRSYNTNKELTGPGDFKWSEGDDIKVWTRYDGFKTLKCESLSNDGDIANYEDNPNVTPLDIAVFPVSAAKAYNNAVVTVNYPAAYDYTQRNATEDDQIANDPMVAFFNLGATTFNFHHTGAVIEWQVMVPAGANKFVATMSKDVTGDFDVSKSSPVAVTSDSTTNNVVTFTFTPSTQAQLLYLYMPVPTGNYHISKVAVKQGDATMKEYNNPKGTDERSIGRAKWIHVLLNMSSYKGVIEDVSNADDLKQVAAAGGIATLNADIDLDGTVFVKSGISLSVNLNNKTVYNSTDIWEQTVNSWSLFSAQGGTLEFNGEGTLKAKENDCYAVDVTNGGKVVINGGHFVGNIHAVYVYEGTAEINGGVFEVQQKYPGTGKGDEFVLNCRDDNYKNGTASIVVKGGTFVGFNPANCQAEGANTNFVAAGYVSEETTYEGKQAWTVKKLEIPDGKVYADGATYSDIKSACNAGATTIYVGKGTYTANDFQNITEGATIIGSGSTILNKEASTISGLKNVTFKNITINSNDTFTSGEQGFSHATGLNFVNCQIKGLLFVYSGTFTGCTFTQTAAAYNVCAYGQGESEDQTMMFSNCTFNGAGKMAKVYGVQSNTKKVYFTNCTFNSTAVNKSAIEIDSSINPFEVYIKNCTLGDNIGDGEHSGIKLYNYDTASNLKVTVDDVEKTLN